jgi:hypothetical protein
MSWFVQNDEPNRGTEEVTQMNVLDGARLDFLSKRESFVNGANSPGKASRYSSSVSIRRVLEAL